MSMISRIVERVRAILTCRGLRNWLRFGAALFSFLATSLFILPAFAATSPVGATQGQFQVSESGSANYTLPLAVPPGTAGMQPSLSLSYNSQGGNGLLGMGLSLGGLSSISRCPQTLAQDGVRGAVNFDANDRFCLDGQRLIVISGVYGADGAEYRTERESYSRIISYGTAGTGPAYFKVWTKSGQVMEYGVTNDSRIEAQGKSSAFVWALNKVQDTVGNYLTLTYLEDNANGQFYPTRIDYTGNASKGLTPYNSVQFVYEARPDVAPAYHAGSLMKTTVRMTKVLSYAGTTLTREYRLVYNQSTATQRSRLATLTECAGDGVCLSPSTLSYQDGNSGFGTDPDIGSYTTGMTWQSGGNFWGDVNGDGRADFVYLQASTSTWHVMLSNGTSLGTDTVWGNSTQGIKWDTGDGPRLIDVNADGMADVVYYQAGSGAVFRVLLSTGTSFATDNIWATTTQGISSYGGNHQFFFPDIDGDGKPDIVYLQDGTATWRGALSSQGTGNTLGPDIVLGKQNFGTVSVGGYHAHYWADVNGDGKADLVYQQDGTSTWRIMLSTSTSLGSDTAWGSNTQGVKWDTGDGPRLVDANGDGKADLVYYQAGSGSIFRVLLSTGSSFAIDSVWGTTTQGISSYGGGHQLFPLDIDGDGKPDIVYFQDGTATWRVALSGQGANGTLGGDGVFGTQTFGTVSSGGYHAHYWADINGDGKPDLAYLRDGTASFKAGLSSTFAPDLLTTITTGQGAVTSITYKPLTDNTVYTKEPGSTYPTLDIQAPIYVVSASSTSDGIGGSYSLNYKYSGMKASQDGRGMLGFRTMDTTDPQTGIVTHNEYRQDYPYTGLPTLSTKKINGTLLNQAQNAYTAVALGGTRYAVQLTQSVESSYELNGSLVTTVTTTNQYDSFGNPTQIVVSTGDGYSKTTANTYTNDSTNWLLGRLTLASVTSATPAAGTLTRTSSFAYHATNGLLTQEVIEPNIAALRLQTDYSYDGYGNKLSVTVSGSGIASRTTSSVYDARGQFPITTTNALNHSDTGTYDARFGKAATLTGPNGLTTTWSYDGFGRKINETRADATQTNVAYNLCDATCPSFAKYYVATTTAGTPISYAYFDMLNREIRVQVQGFDGRLVTKDTYYDSFGRVDRVTKPYYSGDSPLYSYLHYDALGRAIQETAPDNSTKQISYNGLTVVTTNSLAQTETKTKNSQGQLVSVSDNLGNVITYQYDPFGNLTKTTDPKGNQTTLIYDARGRKIGMVDPDMGSWTYTYNVLGELIQQKDAKLQIVNMTYDLLGRMLSRSEPDLVSTWVYDTATKGVGKLKQVSSDNGFLRVYTYDSLGRVSSETSTIDTTYNVSKTYDAYGRVSVLTYPTGVAVKNVYNAYGYLSEVRNNATSALFWKGNAKDADGHVLNETLGNGLTTTRTYTASTGRVQAINTNGVAVVQNQSFTFDALGNLTARFDSVAGFTETFSYDGLNRLTTATQGGVTTTVAYDSIGNITNKSDVGNYTYGAKPHAVTQVTSSLITETIWVDDALPAGAAPTGDESWTWVTGSPAPFAGAKAHQSAIKAGTHQHYFTGATAKLAVATGDTLFAYVYLDPANMPSEVMLQWNDGGWEHRAYWGADSIGWGVNGTNSRRYMGALPPGGQWVKLEVPASAVGLEGKSLNGMAFTLYGGRATWDKAGKASAGGGATYVYDANGNLISGAGRTVTYTSYNQPSQITQGAASVNFIYDADHTRIRQISSSETMIYLNPRIDAGMHFEKEVKGSVTEYKHYIYGAAGVVGVYTTSSAAAPKTSYFHQDHIGSIVAVTDDAAMVVARYAFDPWGKRLLLAGDADATHHGFTGHEHLSDVGLVHMNGRIYDPILARFMSADPYIQFPGNAQSFNRYSYTLNNPLSYTDPSGFSLWTKIRGTVVRVIAAVADAYGCAGYCSAAVGAYQGYKSGGLTGAVVGGIGGYLSYQTSVNYPLNGADGIIWDNVAKAAAINGAIGCASAAAGGGSCGRGAVAGAIGTVGNAYGFMGSVIAGCAAGKISGGSCGDGALNAVVSYAVYSATRYAIDAQRVENPVVRLRVQFSSQDAEMFNSPEESYRYHDGRPELVREEIDSFIHTRRGANIFSQEGVLTVYPEQGADGPSARIGGMSINYNGGRVNGFAHELGHTIWGGSFCDYGGQAAGCGSAYRVGNVQVNENAFRRATGQLPRFWYRETNPNHQYYGKSFYVGPQ